MAQQHARDQKRISRRDALKAIADFPILAYGVMGLGAERLAYLACTEEVLPFCAAGLTACKALLDEGDVLTIAGVLRTYLRTLEVMAHRSSASQQTAAHLASQGYLLAAVISANQRKLDHMGTYCREARVYGQLAGDPNLEVSALLRLAIKFDFEHREQKALYTYQEAAALPSFKEVSPLLRGRTYAGLAGKHAHVQQKDEAQDFLGLAKEAFPEKPEEDPCFQFAHSGNYTLVFWEGLTHKHLGQYAQAWNAFSLDGKLQPDATPLPKLLDRNHTEFLNYAASVAVRQKQLDTSCLFVEAAEDVAWNIKHEQRYAEMLETVGDMEVLWSHEPAVKRLRDKIRARQA